MNLLYKYYPNKLDYIGGKKANATNIKDIRGHNFIIKIIGDDIPEVKYEIIKCKNCGVEAQIKVESGYASFHFTAGIWITTEIINCATERMKIACQ